jgi:hypothetical protein
MCFCAHKGKNCNIIYADTGHETKMAASVNKDGRASADIEIDFIDLNYAESSSILGKETKGPCLVWNKQKGSYGFVPIRLLRRQPLLKQYTPFLHAP